MKKKFPAYFNPSESEYKEIWKNSTFILDTNVLLDLYRYTNETKNELFEIFENLSENIWLPNQVVKEFLDNRPLIIISQQNFFEKTKGIFQSTTEKIKEDIKKLDFKKHPIIDKNNLIDKVTKSINNVLQDLEKEMIKYPHKIDDDKTLEKIVELFNGKIGDPYGEKELAKIYKEGEKRYKDSIPPGYEDSRGDNKKEGYKIYGDLIIWNQIIDYAANNKSTIIFITNDVKEDWWWIVKNKTLGPRIELRDELATKSKAKLFMYNSDRFMTYAKKFLEIEIDEKSIDEVKDIRLKNSIKYPVKEYKGTLYESLGKTLAEALYDQYGTTEQLVELAKQREFLSNRYSDIFKNLGKLSQHSINDAIKQADRMKFLSELLKNESDLRKSSNEIKENQEDEKLNDTQRNGDDVEDH